MSDKSDKLTVPQVEQSLNDIDAAYKELLLRSPDRGGQAAYQTDLLNGAMTPAQMRANMMQSQEYKDKHQGPPVPPNPVDPTVTVPILRVDNRIFRDTAKKDTAWRWKGVSAFALLDRYAKGQDITDTLNAYAGYNLLRVWCYTPEKDWGSKAWPVQSADVTRKFLSYLQGKGWVVELTLLTDDDPARLSWAQGFVPQLAAGPKPGNLLLEGGNEPTTHKNINTQALKSVLDASGFLYASGNYEDASKMYGRFGVCHPQRDNEWPRRAHDALEYHDGGGPNAPTDPKHEFSIICDEPAKPQDVSGNKPDDFRAFFGTASILGGGATYHCESGKFGLPPSGEEVTCAAAALEGLNAFPADAPNGGYRRIDEHGGTLRTYAVGNSMVRIRPTTPNAPEAGWVRTGSSNILWKKG